MARLPFRLNLTDVMKTHVPLEARPPERMGEPAGLVVPLEHQNPLSPGLGEQRRCAESTDARADDDRVESRPVGEPLVGDHHVATRSKARALKTTV
jgi:hypothetical protein